MYHVLFYLRLAIQYLKYAKKIPEKDRELLYIELEKVKQLAEKISSEKP